jgi:hypothetical protein
MDEKRKIAGADSAPLGNADDLFETRDVLVAD